MLLGLLQASDPAQRHQLMRHPALPCCFLGVFGTCCRDGSHPSCLSGGSHAQTTYLCSPSTGCAVVYDQWVFAVAQAGSDSSAGICLQSWCRELAWRPCGVRQVTVRETLPSSPVSCETALHCFPVGLLFHLSGFASLGFKEEVVPCAGELLGARLALIPYSKWSLFFRRQLKEENIWSVLG